MSHDYKIMTPVFFLIFMLSLLLFFPIEIGSTHAKMNQVSMQGQAFGNDGMRFKTFVDCSNQRHLQFSGGARTNFTIGSTEKSMTKSGIGTWSIEYKTGEISNNSVFYKKGYFTSEIINGNHYVLLGTENVDTVCGGAPTSIIVSGEFGENNPVYYQFADGEKMGSTVPPDGSRIYYLLGSDVSSTIETSNNS